MRHKTAPNAVRKITMGKCRFLRNSKKYRAVFMFQTSERGTILSIPKLFSTYIRKSVSTLLLVVHSLFFENRLLVCTRYVRFDCGMCPIHHAVSQPRVISTAFNIFIPTSAVRSAPCNSCQGVGLGTHVVYLLISSGLSCVCIFNKVREAYESSSKTNVYTRQI